MPPLRATEHLDADGVSMDIGDVPGAIAHVRRAVLDTPWAILPAKLEAILELVELRGQGVRFTTEEIQSRIGAAAPRMAARTGAIAVLPLFGTISHRMNMMSAMSGGTSTELFARDFRQLLADETVGTILIDVDSPGGTINGVPELADEIYRARGQKPIIAHANSMAASAAYWIATAADELIVTPSGDVGSIGVLTGHADWSAAHEREGVKITLISAGKFKTEGNPYEPLSNEAREAIQARVNDFYAMFTKAVARHRGVSVETVRSGFGEGRVVGAQEAVRLGMADRVETMTETLRRLASGRRSSTTAALAVGEWADSDVPQALAADPDGSDELELWRHRLDALALGAGYGGTE